LCLKLLISSHVFLHRRRRYALLPVPALNSSKRRRRPLRPYRLALLPRVTDSGQGHRASVFRVRPLDLSCWSIQMFSHFYFAFLLCSRRVLSLLCSMCCLQPASVYTPPATRLPVRNALNPRVRNIDSSVRALTRNERPRRRSHSASNQERHMIALDHAAPQSTNATLQLSMRRAAAHGQAASSTLPAAAH
jgi:hypothetical protein